MSFIPALSYFAGMGVLGFVGWLLDGILQDFVDVGIHESGTVFSFFMYIWSAVFIVYLVFGGYYVIRLYNEDQYRGGMY